jgi:UPF0176 protein
MKVVSLYRFLDLKDPESFRDQLKSLCDEQGLPGTMLVATEGFNGTLAGSEASVRIVMNWIREVISCPLCVFSKAASHR